MKAFEKELRRRRDEDAQPGLFGRAARGVYDWFK